VEFRKGAEVVAVKNRFEQVDEVQDDAITLSLRKAAAESVGTVTFPAAASGGRLQQDQVSEDLPAIDAFRSAVRIANSAKLPIVVMDPDALWQAEWGQLYRPVEQ
jgi:hypothetical protein